jgi:hypothetical protein
MSPEEAQQVSERDETLLSDAEKPKMSELSHPLSAREKRSRHADCLRILMQESGVQAGDRV